MDAPNCNVCHVSLDEDKHQPHHLGCSHDACTACIKALIKEDSLQCPMCRKVIKATKPEDFLINHGVVQILRNFMCFKRSENMRKKEGATASKIYMCRIHNCCLDMRCISCKLWICLLCKRIHTSDIGCEVQDTKEYLKNLKKEHELQAEPTLVSIRNCLELLSSELSQIEMEKKMIEERIEDIQNAVEDGSKTLSEVVTATANIDKDSTSKEVNERLNIFNDLHQFALIWCKKNEGTLLEMLKFGKEVYANMDSNGNSSSAKISIGDGNAYLHCFRENGSNDIKSFKTYPYEQVLTLLPDIRDVVFMDLAIAGVIKGRVTIRLRQDLPNYVKYIHLLFNGEEGQSLLNLYCCDSDSFVLYIGSINDVSKKINKFRRDDNAGDKAEQGSIIAQWSSAGHITSFRIYHEQDQKSFGSNYEVFGQIETGLDIVKFCRNHSPQKKVSVADCGLVIKEEVLRKKMSTL